MDLTSRIIWRSNGRPGTRPGPAKRSCSEVIPIGTTARTAHPQDSQAKDRRQPGGAKMLRRSRASQHSRSTTGHLCSDFAKSATDVRRTPPASHQGIPDVSARVGHASRRGVVVGRSAVGHPLAKNAPSACPFPRGSPLPDHALLDHRAGGSLDFLVP